MAIWQYKIYALPTEEFESYFSKKVKISEDDFDAIPWWKYRGKVDPMIYFPYLKEQKSWNGKMQQFGQLDSNCVEIYSDGDYFEISFRIDLREICHRFINDIIKMAQKMELIFVNTDYEYILPIKEIVMNTLAKSSQVKWMNKLGSED